MGAVFFFIFLGIIFLVALLLIVLSTALIIAWNVKKRKGKMQKKWHLVVPVILLVINIIVALVPVGYIGFLRAVNNSNRQEVIYAESGKIAYWPMGDNYEPTTNRFELDGVKYVRFRDRFSDDSFFLDYSDDRLGEPVANLKYREENNLFDFNRFMWVLLSGSTFAEQNISTIYPVRNDNMFEFYYVSGSPGSASMAGGTYCAEAKRDYIRSYYADISNYDTRNIICKYFVYTDGKEYFSKRGDSPYVKMEKAVTLNEGIFEILDHALENAPERIEISEKYKNIDKAAAPGTPVHGFDERQLFIYSKDKLAYILGKYLVLLENQVYVEMESDEDYINGHPFPADINEYLIDSVFGD